MLPSLVALALAGCSDGPVDQAADDRAAQARAAMQKVISNARPVSLDSSTPLLEWHVAWPAEVSAFPTLERLIRAPAEKAQVDYAKEAAEDKAEREKQGFPWVGAYQYSVDVTVAGDTPRLLSLAREWSEFTGGAHPNHGTEGILWDRKEWRRLTADELFSGGEPAFAALVSGAYCTALDRQRAEKRGSEMQIREADSPFNQCPKLSELAIIPQGPKGGALGKLLFHADPYVAGPYSESDYDVELPVSAAMIAAMKPEFRASFAASQPQ